MIPALPPIFAAITGIVVLLILILWLRLNAFVALLVSSMVVALCAGMPLEEISKSIQTGMGGTLGFIATIIGLGAIFGKLLEHMGGTQALAQALLQRFGLERAAWAMMLTGFLISIPVFFDAALVILMPVIYGLTRKSGRPILLFGIPLLAGMTITHSFVPPTPGPIAVSELLGADLGWVMLLGILTGLPCAIVAGPLFGTWISKRIPTGVPAMMEGGGPPSSDSIRPKLWHVAGLIGLPVILILSASIVNSLIRAESIRPAPVWDVVSFLGHPFTALILATLSTMVVLGSVYRVKREDLGKVCSSALAPAGLIILVTGAGGVLKQVLIDTHAANELAEMLTASGLPVLLLAYVIAAVVRIVQGSATVAMITGASLLAPIITEMGLQASEPQKALWVLAIAAGSMTLSHVNDSGFWLVSRFFGLTERQTFASWSVMTTLVSFCGLLMVLLLSLFIR